jgi:hypothetical protein
MRMSDSLCTYPPIIGGYAPVDKYLIIAMYDFC